MTLTLAASLVAALSVGGASQWEARSVVKTRVYLVKEASFLGARASRTLERGEKLEVRLPQKGSWFAARVEKEQGFIHLSYVSRPPSELKLSNTLAKGESVVSREYNLAVGGFCPPVEQTWRRQNPDVEVGFQRLEPFMPVAPEEAESRGPEPEALAAFAAEGGLKAPPASAQEGGEP